MCCPVRRARCFGDSPWPGSYSTMSLPLLLVGSMIRFAGRRHLGELRRLLIDCVRSGWFSRGVERIAISVLELVLFRFVSHRETSVDFSA